MSMKTSGRVLFPVASTAVVLVLFACSNPAGPDLAADIQGSETNGYSIGDTGPAGGWIFYIDVENEHDWTYLEAAPTDASESVAWSNISQYFGLGVLSGNIGRGASNTALIVAQDGHTESAAQVALDYEAGGFDDWFLPSNMELEAMRDNLHLAGIGNFAVAQHWSSMEMGTGSPNSGRFVDFGNPDSPWGAVTKSSTRRVRPVRSF
ncbi:MAG: hypothetical protein EA382_07110 [Spirochaetaceae bacterium]|nr:MAG: hypothetical protein EA382_07110 [Spirochaetaceae bacterium]